MFRQLMTRLCRLRQWRRESELGEELAFHLPEETEEQVAAGLTPEQARRAARLDFGNIEAVRESTRESWGWGWLERLFQDVRYAVRISRRSPTFTLTATLTFALGVGATTAVFSVVDGVLLRPLPYPEAGRLVRLFEEYPGAVSPLTGRFLSNITFHAWAHEEPRTVSGLAAYGARQYTVGFSDETARLPGASVTPSLFTVLGAAPAAGRFFAPDEAHEGANAVVFLSDQLWRQRFNADRAVVGRTLLLSGRPHLVVGVAPPGFYFPDRSAMLWTPYAVPQPTGEGHPRRVSTVRVLARLQPGATAMQAADEGTAVARSTGPQSMEARLLFGAGGPVQVRATGLNDELTAGVKPALFVLSCGVALVLLIACANVASLLLSRGGVRRREFAVRAALGAGSTRLARQLLTECAMLAALGGSLGLLFGWALIAAAPTLLPSDFPRLEDIRIDRRVFAWAAGASLLAAILSGLAPALRAARIDLTASLKSGAAPGAGRGENTRRMRGALLVLETALAVVLVVGAMLVARSFARLISVDAGYDRDRVLTARVHVPGVSTPATRTEQLVDVVLERLRQVPGVVAAGGGNMMPFGDYTYLSAFSFPARDGVGSLVEARALEYTVTPGYGEALGLRLREGRFFNTQDLASGIQPVLVNEEFARLYLPEPPEPGRIFPNGMGSSGAPARIVGIVGNVLKNGLDAEPQAEIYLPPGPEMRMAEVSLVVRTAGDVAALAPILRSIVREADPTAAVYQVSPLAQLVSESVQQPRFAAAVLGTFALLALLLAALGLYGVLSYVVSQRRHELGVRAALGANRSDLIAPVLGQGMRSTFIGVACGLAAAAVLTRQMEGLLFNVAPLDPVSFVAAPALVVFIALVACLIPALRAAAADPIRALKSE